MATMQQGCVIEKPPRQIVSYFDHEFIKPTPAKLEADVAEMQAAGFTDVVLCVTESDLREKRRRKYIAEATATLHNVGMDVWADPWAVGGVFGGEGVSLFRNSGEVCCDHNPKLEYLLDTWLNAVAESGITTVFWDEPEMHCNDDRGNELAFLEKYTDKAGELALRSAVCLCANALKRQQFHQVAALPAVTELAADPYFPNAFSTINEADRQTYVAGWAQYVKQIAERHGKASHAWVQTFDVPAGREVMIDEHVAAICNQGVDVAVWGFHGCESVPGFTKPANMPPRAAWERVVGALALRRAA